jgi:arginine decarboxylase
MMPTRNGYGIIGPIAPVSLCEEIVLDRIRARPLASPESERPELAVITNSTYDGLCYHVPTIVE